MPQHANRHVRLVGQRVMPEAVPAHAAPRRYAPPLLAVIALACCLAACHGREGLENARNTGGAVGQTWVLPAKKTHPCLLFDSADCEAMRRKTTDPYFKTFTRDMLANADHLLATTKDDEQYPFAENPNFQCTMENLIAAHIVTGEEKYPRKAIRLLMTFIASHHLKVPIRDAGKFKGFPADGNSISFILPPIAFAYDCLYPLMSAEERLTVRQGLAYFCKITYQMSMTAEYDIGFSKNYTAGQMGGLGLACLALLEDEWDPETQAWLDKALRTSIGWCDVAVKGDGVYPEGVPYFYYMIRNQLLFLRAMERKTGVDYFAKTNLGASVKWVLWSSLPWGGEFDNFSDGNYSFSPCDIPYFFQKLLPGCGDYLVHKFDGGHLRYRSNPLALLFGRQPRLDGFNPRKELGLAALFGDSGIAGFRTGWEREDILLLCYATDYENCAHSQADRGHFTLCGFDRKWVVDSGYGNDAKTENSATPSDAHNLVLIDGVGQGFEPVMRQAGIYADIDAFAAGETLGFARIDQKQAYDYYVHYDPSVKRPFNKVEKAFRHVIFVNKGDTPSYAVIYDDIQKDDAQHLYTWLLHTDPGNKIDIGQDSVAIRPFDCKGKSILMRGSGSWEDPVMPGFDIFRRNAAEVSYTFDAVAGEYCLWALGRRHPRSGADVEVWVNGKNCGRFKPGQTRDFCWNVFSLNTDKMHKPEMVTLAEGRNTIKFVGLLPGAEITKLFVTKNPAFFPSTATPPVGADSFILDTANAADGKQTVVRDVDGSSEVMCSVRVLNPADTTVVKDSYQPTSTPRHPVLKAQISSVNPRFLVFLQPRKPETEVPQISTERHNDHIHAKIVWSNAVDNIYINLTGKTYSTASITTDSSVLFCRTGKDGAFRKAIVAEGSELALDGRSLLKEAGKTTTIIGD